jgi:hypothetical protein
VSIKEKICEVKESLFNELGGCMIFCPPTVAANRNEKAVGEEKPC